MLVTVADEIARWMVTIALGALGYCLIDFCISALQIAIALRRRRKQLRGFCGACNGDHEPPMHPWPESTAIVPLNGQNERARYIPPPPATWRAAPPATIPEDLNFTKVGIARCDRCGFHVPIVWRPNLVDAAIGENEAVETLRAHNAVCEGRRS